MADGRRVETNDRKPLVSRTGFVFLPITDFAKADAALRQTLACSKRYDNALGGEFDTGAIQ